MSQFGKASSKRGKPSYLMSIIGVSIVLFFVGIFGWIFLSASLYIKGLKEEVKMVAYLQNNARKPDIDSLQAYLTSQPFTKSVEYVDKETAKKKWLGDGESDFNDVIEENPLPASIEFNLKGEYVQKDTMVSIKNNLLQRVLVVQSVNYPVKLVEEMGKILRYVLIGLIVLAVFFSVLSIILIDNTIRLAMYSNRFLIKTMQMVGATRNFISRPMSLRAVINGTIAALVAIGVIYGLILVLENFVPYLRDLRDNGKLALLFLLLIALGIGITIFSTNRSITKYLRMKLDDLY